MEWTIHHQAASSGWPDEGLPAAQDGVDDNVDGEDDEAAEDGVPVHEGEAAVQAKVEETYKFSAMKK